MAERKPVIPDFKSWTEKFDRRCGEFPLLVTRYLPLVTGFLRRLFQQLDEFLRM